MKKLAILIFSLFIVGVSYAEDCSQTSDFCYPLISNSPTQLLCSNNLYTTMAEGCRNVCTAGAVYSGTNCACDSGFYRTLGGVFDVTGDTCTACSVAQTAGRVCTCAGGTAAPVCKFPVTLNINGGTGTPGSTTHCTTGTSCQCPDGTACALPSSGITAPSGYVFDGWNSAADGSGTDYGTSYTFSSGNITIYARWKKTITFYEDVVMPATSQAVNCYHGGNLTFPSLPTAPTGFSIYDSLWYENNDGTGTSYTYPGSQTCDSISILTFYPRVKYVVTYDGNGRDGGASVPSTTECLRNQNCHLSNVPAMTRTGYTLDAANWNTNATGTGTDYAGNLTTFNNAAGNISLYAQWDVNSITISYDANGGTGTVSPTSCVYGGTCNLATTSAGISRAGYTLTKWCKTAAGDVPADCFTPGSSQPQLAVDGTNLTLYAKWNITFYTITYDLNGGNCPVGGCIPSSYTINTLTIPLPSPHKSGNVFAGWLDGSNIIWTIPLGSTGDKILVAQWTACGAGSWDNAGNCELCPIGYYCTGDFTKLACPRATTTTATGSTAKSNCKLVQGSKICDVNNVCYTFPNGTSIPWQGS